MKQCMHPEHFMSRFVNFSTFNLVLVNCLDYNTIFFSHQRLPASTQKNSNIKTTSFNTSQHISEERGIVEKVCIAIPLAYLFSIKGGLLRNRNVNESLL